MLRRMLPALDTRLATPARQRRREDAREAASKAVEGSTSAEAPPFAAESFRARLCWAIESIAIPSTTTRMPAPSMASANAESAANSSKIHAPQRVRKVMSLLRL